MLKSTKWHEQASVDMYRGLHGNLRLWSVEEPVVASNWRGRTR